MHRILIRDIMQQSLVTIRPEQLVADADQMMEEFSVRRLPVVDETGYLVGIVTDADVHEAEAANRVLNDYEPGAEEEWLTVGDVMTREVVTIPVDATVGQLAATLIEHKVLVASPSLSVMQSNPTSRAWSVLSPRRIFFS